jgi:hypothetical protein
VAGEQAAARQAGVPQQETTTDEQERCRHQGQEYSQATTLCYRHACQRRNQTGDCAKRAEPLRDLAAPGGHDPHRDRRQRDQHDHPGMLRDPDHEEHDQRGHNAPQHPMETQFGQNDRREIGQGVRWRRAVGQAPDQRDDKTD